MKWPNDVLIGGARSRASCSRHRGSRGLRVGINVNQTVTAMPAETRTPAASLLTVAGDARDRAALLVVLLDLLERRDAWLGMGLAPLLPELEHRDALRGAR